MNTVDICPPDDWDKLVKSSNNGSIFCETRWINLFEKPYQLYGYYKNDNLIGGIAGFVDGKEQATFKSCYLLTPFMGVVVGSEEGKSTTKESLRNEVALHLIDFLKGEFASVEVSNHYTFADIRPFIWNGFHQTVKYTYVMNLVDMEAAWFNMEQDTRYEINRADKNGLAVDNGTMGDFLIIYNGMWERKEMASPLPDEFFLKMEQEITPDIYIATGGAGVVMIHDHKRAYYILGASNTPHSSAFCLWEAMKDQYNKGIREIDMVGANTRSISLYKRGFGGRLVPYYQVKGD
ncbi:GNAT family N-acetyltransferase [Patescibacteria group bacterium]|nr:GNAT family N-acetyltransferase [Patescibacteria group bacterium]